jgi:hypothetical protein
MVEFDLSLGIQEVGGEHTVIAECPSQNHSRCGAGRETDSGTDA